VKVVARLVLLDALAASVLSVSCAPHPARGAGATMPGYAPDSTPLAIQRELTRPENVLVDPPGISGRVVKNALYVRFRDSASEAEQAAALRAVGAVVIGGMRGRGFELYHLRLDVPPDSGAGPLLRAREALRAMPQVQMVLLEMLGPTP